MIAAVLISRNPDQYGFSNIRYRKPIEHEVIRVPAGTPLKAVAASASIKLSQLKELNNDLLKNRVPTVKGGWSLKVPAGRAALVAANLPNTLQHSTASYGSHRVAKNETLSGISKRYHVSMTDLLKVNNLRSSRLRIGQYLRIPGAQGSETSSTQYALAETKKVTPAPSYSATEKYTLRKGETLSHVSAKYNVSVASLMKWNKINRASSIRAGQKLTVHLPETAVAEVASNSSSGTVASTVKIADAGKDSSGVATLTISGKGKRKAGAAVEKTAVSYYKVRSGDSLWSISKKLQVSTNDIKDWNSLNGNQLQPGTTLVIKNG
jgi:membrane-bound lytic murein transglycosylase D